MTSHWPYKIRVNSLQVRNFGDKTKIIEYENLTLPELDDLEPKIYELINPYKYKQLGSEPESEL